MKKYLIFLLILMFIIGCGQQSTSNISGNESSGLQNVNHIKVIDGKINPCYKDIYLKFNDKYSYWYQQKYFIPQMRKDGIVAFTDLEQQFENVTICFKDIAKYAEDAIPLYEGDKKAYLQAIKNCYTKKAEPSAIMEEILSSYKRYINYQEQIDATDKQYQFVLSAFNDYNGYAIKNEKTKAQESLDNLTLQLNSLKQEIQKLRSIIRLESQDNYLRWANLSLEAAELRKKAWDAKESSRDDFFDLAIDKDTEANRIMVSTDMGAAIDSWFYEVITQKDKQYFGIQTESENSDCKTAGELVNSVINS